MSTEPLTTRKTRALVLMLVALGALLRFSCLTSRSLWLDEYTSIEMSLKSVADIIHGVGFNRHTPPAYYLFLHYWFLVFPVSEFGLRLFSLLIDLVNIILVYAVFSKQFSKQAGILTAVLYTCSSYAIYYAQEGRMYTLLLCLVLLTYHLALSLCEDTFGAWKSVALVVIGTIGMYTHYYYALSLLGISVGLLFALKEKRTSAVRWSLLCAIVGLFFLPWLRVIIGLADSGGQEFRRFVFLELPYTFYRFVAGYAVMPVSFRDKLDIANTLREHFTVLSLYSATFLAVSYLGLSRLLKTSHDKRGLLFWALLFPPLAALLLSLKSPLLSERYLIVVFPFFLCLLARGLSAEVKGKAEHSFRIFVALLFAFSLFMHYTNEDFGNTDWRSAASFIREKAPTGASVVVNPEYAAGVLRFYLAKRYRVLPQSAAVMKEIPGAEAFLVEQETGESASGLWLKQHFRIVQKIELPLENGLMIYELAREADES